MKIISAIVVALGLLLVSCKNETPVNQTNTATSSTAAADARETLSTAASHPTPAAAITATNLKVNFTGMVVFVLGNSAHRAVILRAPSHRLQIVFPMTMKTEVETVFSPLKCGIECIVPFSDVSFQVVDRNGVLLSTPFSTAGNFSTAVTHLGSVPLSSAVKDTFDAGNIEGDVLATPKPSTLIGGYFDLNGGVGTVKPFTCKAHFGSDMTTSQSFPDVVSVNFGLPAGAKLQVNKRGGGWVDLVTLTSLPASPTITVDNDMRGSVHASHFDNYALLSKKRVNGKPVKLPDVNQDDPFCVNTHGGMPGCSDSQWP